MDSHFWHACAGGTVQIPPLNSIVYYFPQGHAEHVRPEKADFCSFVNCRNPPYFLCQVSDVNLTADTDTDEVYAKIKLLPLQNNTDSDPDSYSVGVGISKERCFFAKTLTQSDANNGGGLSIPRHFAETLFPKLDYAEEPPVQVIIAKDVHGKIWRFQHIYRGTPRRHLLTTGWSSFVSHKKLVAGDSLVFFKSSNGDLCVGIRRGNRVIKSDSDSDSDSVVEAVNAAVAGELFEVTYYPRVRNAEFCVKASVVNAAMKIRWCPGMRFKMAFEAEDSSRISWVMGTVSLVGGEDQMRWPDSPWRLLEVTWDEPELLQNVKRVNPWLVELVASMPEVHPSLFSAPTKKLRFTCTPDYSVFAMPLGIQGARHSSQFGLDHNPRSNQTHPFPPGPDDIVSSGRLSFQERDENVSCLLTIGTDNHDMSSKKKSDEKDKKTHILVLFGQPILNEPQVSETGSSDTNGSVVLQSGSSEEVGPLV